MRKLTKEDMELFGDVQPMERTHDNLNAYRLQFDQEYLGERDITEVDEETETVFQMRLDPVDIDLYAWVFGESLKDALKDLRLGEEGRINVFSIHLAIEGEESDNTVSLTGEKLLKFLKDETELKLMTSEEADNLI